MHRHNLIVGNVYSLHLGLGETVPVCLVAMIRVDEGKRTERVGYLVRELESGAEHKLASGHRLLRKVAADYGRWVSAKE